MENTLEKLPMRRGGTAARIAVIPGDGIGKEVTPEALKVLKAVTAADASAPSNLWSSIGARTSILRENISLARRRSGNAAR